MDIETYISTHYVGAVRSVALFCGDVGWAEDAVQHALQKALERERRNRAVEHLPGWVVVVALNEVRRRGRRRSIERRVVDDLTPRPASADPAAELDLRHDIARAIANLPQRQRQVLLLYYFHDAAVADIAALLGISAGTVKTALSRARSALATAPALIGPVPPIGLSTDLEQT